VAISKAKGSDNASTHVIKLKPRPNGTFVKEVVYTKVQNGISLPKQRDFLRELVHIKFPNCIKLVIDMRGNGEPLPSLFYETWEYTNPKTKEVVEYPPLVLDDDPDGLSLKGSIPLIRGITATVISNNTMYTYLKACFEDQSIRLLLPSEEVDIAVKNEEIKPEEFANYIQTDILIQELSNIKQDTSGKSGNIIYDRIIQSKKRDRVTSLAYGLSMVYEMEMENRKFLHQDDTNELEVLMQYSFFV
jgi:hypothetical protein